MLAHSITLGQRGLRPLLVASLALAVAAGGAQAAPAKKAAAKKPAPAKKAVAARKTVAAKKVAVKKPVVKKTVAVKPAGAAGMVQLQVQLPRPVFAGTPSDVPPGTTVEKPSKKPRVMPMVPAGTTNVALGKKVTSSKAPFMGALQLVTDGDKEARDGTCVELMPRLQWCQIDLGAPYKISNILVWHYHMVPVVCHDVIVQVSNDPNFVEGVKTVYNNDQDNSAGLGIGKDREYFETNEGRLMDAKGEVARYVRLYSNGSTYTDKLNRYTEVEVYGTPAK